ncbi:hypothetical protein ACCO45_013282 [Purpureocillium lilacinum]|uniref:Uncharacterized protein n=1 Tax=Purpureocillium lilacinum TaxID=33203 RepID=A0ACC4DCL2_PURLI
MISLKHPGRTGQVVAEPSSSRVVPRPVPESHAQDPRGYQLAQLRRCFSPRETAVDGATSLVFKLVPSDPDFPFELAHLECDLRVPDAYPDARPQLRVRNSDMPRGFAINVERGWERLAEKKTSTLLALVNALDKNLETFFPLGRTSATTTGREAETAPYNPEPSYTREQTAEAKARRAQEVRQLEARMGRLPRFRRSPDGVVFTLPIEPKRRDELPPGLHSVNSLHLIVPLLYPLQDLRVQLNEADAADAEPVEELFTQRAASQKSMSLMSHVNYLAQNLHTLDKQARLAKKAQEAEAEKLAEREAAQKAQEKAQDKPPETEHSHIKVIQRPPEWDRDTDSDEDTEESSDDGGAVLQSDQPAETPTEAPTDTPERGTMISFPYIELHGIEVLQISILSLTVKCDRCRTPNDMTGLKPGQLVHQNSTRAGFIDLSGCRVADMLPSTFVPTCSRCSTPCQGLVSVRGETTTNVCRECHGKFTFKVPEIKFLFITPRVAGPADHGAPAPRGEARPPRGGAAAGPGREQNYAVDSCTFCGRSVIGKRGRGFWEGGKGTRDQRMMSRKDPRKYKRLGPG